MQIRTFGESQVTLIKKKRVEGVEGIQQLQIDTLKKGKRMEVVD